MKKSILTAVLCLACFAVVAQNLNPLNFSGKMYVQSMVILSTPRYVSYENHAILSKDMTIPMTKIVKCILDFENGIITIDGKEDRIKVTAAKNCSSDSGSCSVIFMDMLDSPDKMELVWPEYGQPYIQQITKSDDGVKIARVMLSKTPVVADPNDVMLEMFKALGTM